MFISTNKILIKPLLHLVQRTTRRRAGGQNPVVRIPDDYGASGLSFGERHLEEPHNILELGGGTCEIVNPWWID